MAETKNKLQQELDNKKTFLEKSKTAFESELALFERFFQSITHHAQTHRQITLNNEAIEERLISSRNRRPNLKTQLST